MATLSRDARSSTLAKPQRQASAAQPRALNMDIETISLDDVEIIPANVVANNSVTDITNLTDDVIVVPPATAADVMTPITSELLTYSLLQNTAGTVPVTSATVTQGNFSYSFRPDSSAAVTQITHAANVTPVSADSVMSVSAALVTPVLSESVTSIPAESATPVSAEFVTPPCPVSKPLTSIAQPGVNDLAPPPPKKPKTDDAVFLTPLPIITYTKAANRTAKQHPKPKPSNTDQNQFIKSLLAKSTQGTYVARPQPPRGTTNFIIRASTQTPSGKRQIVNLPVSVSTPISIVRNVTQGVPVRPIITHNLLVRPGVPVQGPASRSTFVTPSTGNDFTAREPVTSAVANAAMTLATATMAITAPMSVVPQGTYSISPIITTTGVGAVVTTTVSGATSNPFTFTSTAAVPRTKSFPTYTKTYIPLPHSRVSKRNGSTPKTVASLLCTTPNNQNLVGSRVLPAHSNTRTPMASNVKMLGSRGPVVSPRFPTFVHRPLGHVRTNIVQGCRSKHLEPGEIPQVRKVPPRTFLGPRSASTAHAQHQAQMKAARHARHHEESQAQLRALRRHGASRALLHATSLAALQAASHAQLEAAARARLKAQQARLRKAAQLQLPTASETPLQITSLGQLQTVSLAQPQGTLNVQLLTASQAQLLAATKMQLLTTSQAQLQATSPAQIQITSQVQTQGDTQAHIIHAAPQVQTQAKTQAHIIHAVSQAQFQSTSQVQIQANTQAHIIHAVPHVQAQSNTQAHIIHALSQVQLQATSPTPLKPNSQVQVRATTPAHIIHTASQAPPQTNLQAQLKTTSRTQLQATSQAHIIHAIPQTQLQLQTTSQAKLKTTPWVQIQATTQAQFTAVSQAQLQTTPQVQLQATSHAQIQATAQAHIIHAVSQAHLQAASQAQLQATSQAQIQANARTHIIHAVSQAQLQTTQQALLQATSRAQLQATTKAHIIHAVSQAQLQTASQAQLPATSRVNLIHAVSQATSQAQCQITTQASIIHAVSQAQLQATSRAQLQATSRVQLIHAISQAQLHAASQAQPTTHAHIIHAIPQAQLQTAPQAQLQVTQAQAKSQEQLRGVTRTPPQAMPNARTHHRLIIRSVNPNAAKIINSPAIVQGTTEEHLPNTPQQGSETASSSIHTTTTLTLSTGTTLIMPHYKTTLFKNVSNIARAEPNQLVTPTTTAVTAAAVETIIRHPIAYFSARRAFPTSESGTPVNVQRHIIRTIPRHILDTHLRSIAPQAARVAPVGQTPQSALATGPQIPEPVSTLSTDSPCITLSQNKSQSTEKKK